ncbi:carbohydrate ABC transporter permease [Kribbella sp. NPDC048915]|uniref:carbohydrate ABC transporter permease n=1 Tax=Kribbella sp. NPDC048915 TaxID=3155148 RepID=UPI0034001845
MTLTTTVTATPREQQKPPASAPHHHHRRRRARRVLVYAVLIAGVVPTVLPFIWLVRSALMNNNQMFIAPPEWIPRPFEWRNFTDALTAQPFARYFLNTMIIEVFTVTGTLLTCSIAAFSFSRLRWRGRNVVFGILLSGLMLPQAVLLVPTFLMWDAAQAINTYYPLIVPAWFGGAGGGIFNVFLLRQFFLTIPYELDEAAYIDGASPWRVFWQVIVPLSKPALMVVGIFTFIRTWNEFLDPLIYLNDSSKFTLALGLASFQGTYNAQWGYLMAAATATILPIILLFFFAQRYLIEGVTLTGVKG